MWLALLTRFWKPLALVALLISATLWAHHAGFVSGHAASEADWRPRFAAAERARDVANSAARQKEADSKALSDRSEKEYAASIASLNLRAADADQRIRALVVRLAAARAGRRAVSTLSGPATLIDGPASGASRADGVGASLADLGRRCEADSLTLAALQSWITEQRAVMNSPRSLSP